LPGGICSPRDKKQSDASVEMTKFRKWTEEDDTRLIELRAAGKPPAVIAKELKRTEAAVVSRIGILKKREK
jgi:Myb-like DNA-binding domain